MTQPERFCASPLSGWEKRCDLDKFRDLFPMNLKPRNNRG